MSSANRPGNTTPHRPRPDRPDRLESHRPRLLTPATWGSIDDTQPTGHHAVIGREMGAGE